MAGTARMHDYRQTGIPCAPGCVQLASAASLAARAATYRVDAADLAKLVTVTGGWCMVCRDCHASVVEHCHDTGRVRGLVCRWCNNRLAHTEGAYPGRAAVYPRRYLCPCITTGDRTTASVGLEAATYAYLDHATDLVAATPRDALALLVADPYPAT
jgi:NADH pyrophosphatase NudC (nudix superfamily)